MTETRRPGACPSEALPTSPGDRACRSDGGTHFTLTTQEIGDRILGAKIVAIADKGDGKSVILDFEHRGTDDDSGALLVAREDVSFHD